MRLITLRVLMAGLGLLVGLAVVEVSFQVADVAPKEYVRRLDDHPTLETNALFGWSFIPNREFTYTGINGLNRFSTRVKINSKGLRDRDYGYRKGNSAFRILVLGDSFSAALEVPLEQTWHEILENQLTTRQGTRRIEVINAGVRGWGTDQELLYYANEGYKYSPDLVILQFFANDIADSDTPSDAVLRREKPFFIVNDRGQLELINFPYTFEAAVSRLEGQSPLAQIKRGLRRNVRTYRFVRDLMVARPMRRREPPFFCDGDSPRKGVHWVMLPYAGVPRREDSHGWDLMAKLLAQLTKEIRGRGQQILVLYTPAIVQVHPGFWQETLKCWPDTARERWDLDKPNRLLAAILKREGVSYLDLTPAFRKSVPRTGSLHFWRDGHFNAEGHRLAAQILREKLVRERWVP